MNARSALIASGLLAMAVSSMADAPPTAQTAVKPSAVQEEKLGAMPASSFIYASPDCGRAAILVSSFERKKSWVVVDGKPDPEYDAIVFGTIKFSPDSRRLAYVAAKGKKQAVVVDGREVGEGDEVKGLTFSPDSRHIAFIARTGAKAAAVLDGKPGAEYDGITMSAPIFSPDSNRLAYVGRIEKTVIDGKPVPPSMRNMPGYTKEVVVVDEKAGPEYDGCADPVFSPDSKRVAYKAFVFKDSAWSAVVDGKAGPSYNSILSLVFSPDSKRVAYAAMKGQRQLAVTDDLPGPEYTTVMALTFSPDSRHIAYVAEKGSRGAAVLDGQEGPEFDKIFTAAKLGDKLAGLLFSADSNRLAYIANKGNKKVAVVDGAPGPDYDDIRALLFSRDSRRVAYQAVNGAKGLVVADGKAGAEFDEIIFDTLLFSPDSTRIAYLARNARRPIAVVDGKPGPAYDPYYSYARVVFSPDSKRAAYPAKQGPKTFVVLDDKPEPGTDGLLDGSPWFCPDNRLMYFVFKNGKYSAVLDGQEGPPCEKIIGLGVPNVPDPPHPKFHPGGTVEYLASKDGALVRIKHIPPPPASR